MKRATTTGSTPSTRVQQMQLACVAASFLSQYSATVIHYTAQCTAPTAGSSTSMNAKISSKSSSHYKDGGEESHTLRTTLHQHQCKAEQGRSCRHSQQTACHPLTPQDYSQHGIETSPIKAHQVDWSKPPHNRYLQARAQSVHRMQPEDQGEWLQRQLQGSSAVSGV